MLRSRTVRIFLGVFFLTLAVVGSLLPILQGWLFLAAALFILSPDIPLFRKWFCALKRKYPKARGGMERWQRWMEKRGVRIEECPPAAGNEPGA